MQQKRESRSDSMCNRKGPLKRGTPPPLQTPACYAEGGPAWIRFVDSSGAIQLEGCAAEWED